MNCSVVREKVIPPVQSVVLVLTQAEAVELQRTITSANSAPIKDRVFDALTKTFRTEAIDGGIYV